MFSYRCLSLEVHPYTHPRTLRFPPHSWKSPRDFLFYVEISPDYMISCLWTGGHLLPKQDTSWPPKMMPPPLKFSSGVQRSHFPSGVEAKQQVLTGKGPEGAFLGAGNWMSWPGWWLYLYNVTGLYTLRFIRLRYVIISKKIRKEKRKRMGGDEGGTAKKDLWKVLLRQEAKKWVSGWRQIQIGLKRVV